MADTLPAHLQAALDQWAANGREATRNVVAKARKQLAGGDDPTVVAFDMASAWKDFGDQNRLAMCAAFAVIALAQQSGYETGGDGDATGLRPRRASNDEPTDPEGNGNE